MDALPPLNSLRMFEAAARLGGFTRAAAELNVTQSAFSRQVATLEAVRSKNRNGRETNELGGV
ncbi:MAG: LysR family transcriptional regulator, partial [Hyphomicrobiales bacterium]